MTHQHFLSEGTLAAMLRCRRALAKDDGVFQLSLLNTRAFLKHIRDRGLSLFSSEQIEGLWQIGILRADLLLVANRESVETFGLRSEPSAELEAKLIYCDDRSVLTRANGYGGSLGPRPRELDNIELFFHPFRLYVAYHVCRVMEQHGFSATQFLQYPEGLEKIAKFSREHLDEWTSSDGFARSFESWNTVSELAIVLEPTSFPIIFGVKKFKSPDTEETADIKRRNYLSVADEMLFALSLEEASDVRGRLGRDAQMIDDNTLFHVLIRLMSGHERMKLKGNIGAAMWFLSMSETIRREVERFRQTLLPEEDEIGFGRWMPGSRRVVYGTERIFDATLVQRRDFLTSMGLDAGIKARCYVEGDTEFGAISFALKNIPGVEVINLRSQVVARGGRGLAFAESLKADIKAHIFSVVLIDSDRGDYVRALMRAAEDGWFFGCFFIAKPDFELANFSIDELLTISLDRELVKDSALDRNALASEVKDVTSAEKFFRTLRKFGIDVEKGQRWGEALARFAIKHPDVADSSGNSRERSFVEAVNILVRAQFSGYVRSRDQSLVDPKTGRLVLRKQPLA